ncbi:MAG: iron-containing alcohol dehydrogenase [Gemmatimonadota bacterium]|nr:iron-containing alcohol dehydrogenase [Gemmatimonadota bacterium]
MTIPNRNLNYPTAIKFGAGRIKELADHCRASGIMRPLFVTDPALAAMPMVQAIVEDVRRAGLGLTVFSDVRSNPVEANVTDGVRAFTAGNHDGVVACGGGSALDIGKMVALMHGQQISVFELEDVDDWWTRADASKIAPVIAVPTTAGTGSEVGRAGVVTHPVTHEKKIIFHPAIMPKVAILDPELTVGLPAKLTAATGMDAMAHNLEAYCTPAYHPLSAGVALEGMRLIKDNLPQAVMNGADLDARGNMLVASAMGAVAFQRGLGAIHALSHPFGGLYDAHHGLLNGIIMPYVLKANRRAIEPDIKRAAAYLGIKGGFGGFLKWVLALRQEIGIPHTLGDIGIDTARLDVVAAMAMKDPTAGSNPIAFTKRQYKALALKCVTGNL